jgi:1,4-dihydroxy-2-naphthoyl-CoA hydrolase
VAIWKTPMTLDAIGSIREMTMTGHLGIEFTELGEDYLKGRMPVDARTKQPFGIMHGGASCVLAETLGSIAGCYCVDLNKQVCVGLTLNINHIRMVREGWVYGTARPVHLGHSTQVWDIAIENEEGKLVSSTRLTLAVIDRK